MLLLMTLNLALAFADFDHTVLRNPYIPHNPTVKQAEFLARTSDPELLYGGAAGGGKSDVMLMAALQYVCVPEYRALLLRRTFSDLALPGAIMDRAHQWLKPTDARWNNQEKTYHFPSGASLTFGYLDNEQDKYRYQSAEFQFIGFDELTQFTEAQYTYLFSRLRRLANSETPLRMRAATNPGGKGHAWVYRRFIDERTASAPFIPAKLGDNPHICRDEYEATLGHLDIKTRTQMRDGVWKVDNPSACWRWSWIEENRVREVPCDLAVVAVAIDPSTTPDGDEAGIVAGGKGVDGHYYVTDDESIQGSPNTWAKAAVRLFDRLKADRIVCERNQGGLMCKTTLNTVRKRLPVKLVWASRGKVTRAEPVASLYEEKLVHHVGNFDLMEDEQTTWTQGDPDSPNRMDALVWLLSDLSGKGDPGKAKSVRRGGRK